MSFTEFKAGSFVRLSFDCVPQDEDASYQGGNLDIQLLDPYSSPENPSYKSLGQAVIWRSITSQFSLTYNLERFCQVFLKPSSITPVHLRESDQNPRDVVFFRATLYQKDHDQAIFSKTKTVGEAFIYPEPGAPQPFLEKLQNQESLLQGELPVLQNIKFKILGSKGDAVFDCLDLRPYDSFKHIPPQVFPLRPKFLLPTQAQGNRVLPLIIQVIKENPEFTGRFLTAEFDLNKDKENKQLGPFYAETQFEVGRYDWFNISQKDALTKITFQVRSNAGRYGESVGAPVSVVLRDLAEAALKSAKGRYYGYSKLPGGALRLRVSFSPKGVGAVDALAEAESTYQVLSRLFLFRNKPYHFGQVSLFEEE